MKENVSNSDLVSPMLFPYQPEKFWQFLRQIIREEVNRVEQEKPVSQNFETQGMTYKPLYKMPEVCALLRVTKPTIYDWIKHGKLKPYKIRSRVYFLAQDVMQLLHPDKL